MDMGSRLDHPGSLHHVMCHAVDGCAPFIDIKHASTFMYCLGRSVEKTGLSVLAWAVMPNHVHLFIRCREQPLSATMQSLLVSFAMIFNHETHRRGHLFRGKYKSILVENGSYAMQLVRYIHLNPVRAGLVRSIDALDYYPLTGHSGFVRNQPEKWHDLEGLRSLLNKTGAEALSAYSSLLRTGDGIYDESPELDSGSWLLGKSGLVEASRVSLTSRRYQCWGAVLGSREFALETAQKLGSSVDRRIRVRVSLEVELQMICALTGISRVCLTSDSRLAPVVSARSMAARFLVEQRGLSMSEVARMLKHTPSSVGKMLERTKDPLFGTRYSDFVEKLGSIVKTDLMGEGG